MAILTAIFGFLGRFVGRALSTTLGWASVLLFGRIPEDRRVRFSLLTLGSLVWVAAVYGVVFPGGGAFLLLLVPLTDRVDEGIVRLVMLLIAVGLPAVLGAVVLWIGDPADRPTGRALIGALARGYLVAPILAGTLIVLAAAGIVRKSRAILARRSTGQLPIVIRPGRYDALVDRLEEVLRGAELVNARHDGSAVLTMPAKLLAAVSGRGLRALVPHRLQVLTGPDLELAVYPSDLAMTGSKLARARGRAAVMRDLDSRDCWFTTSKGAQEIEDLLAGLAARPDSWDPSVIDEVDRRLATEEIPDDEWDVLYSRRLQLAAKATGTNIRVPAANEVDVPGVGWPRQGRPDFAALAGLVAAGLLVADIVVLAGASRDNHR
jgi:hypothetical protein